MSEFIGVLRHMQQYFSHICDGTDVQADWRRSCTYSRAPNAIDIWQGSLTCPSYTDTGPPFLYGDSDTPPHLVALYDTLGIRRMYSRLKPPASSQGRLPVKDRQQTSNEVNTSMSSFLILAQIQVMWWHSLRGLCNPKMSLQSSL